VQTVDPRAESITLKIDTHDGGALVRFMDFYSRMQGGRLTSDIAVSAAGQAGIVQVRDFMLRDEPAVRQYGAVAPAGAEGAAAVARRASTDVQFTKMRLDFTRRPGRLDLREAVMWGPTIGGTLEGTLDYARDVVDLKGSFVPAYALNNIFAQVPVFGMLLGGSQYEGLFAVPFIINGKASAPVLRTNPISAIAPGFMRKFFEIQREQPSPRR
jgi:AsmA-like C-terminal region